MYLQLFMYLFLMFQNQIILNQIHFLFIISLIYFKVLYPYDLIYFLLNHLKLKSFILTYYKILNYLINFNFKFKYIFLNLYLQYPFLLQ